MDIEKEKAEVQRRLDYLQGRLPTFYCDKCRNAINAKTCPVCLNRITDARWHELHDSLLK